MVQACRQVVEFGRREEEYLRRLQQAQNTIVELQHDVHYLNNIITWDASNAFTYVTHLANKTELDFLCLGNIMDQPYKVPRLHQWHIN